MPADPSSSPTPTAFRPAPTACCSAILRQHAASRSRRRAFGHDPQYPVTNNWPHLVQQLADFAPREVSKARRAGLSGGPFAGRLLSLMAAARFPHWRAACCCSTRPSSAAGAPPRWGGQAHADGGRRHRGASAAPAQQLGRPGAALEHFRHKKAFARWDPQVLQDYMTHGTARRRTAKRVLASTARWKPRSTTPCRTTWTACCGATR
jgi:hypothetical protein